MIWATLRRLVPLVVTLVLVALFLWLYARHGLEEFERSQRALAQQSVEGASRLITHHLEETRRRVGLFADDEVDVIAALSAEPDDEPLQALLDQRLRRHFRDYFAFTVADENGDVLLDDFDGKVDMLCVLDIRSFAGGQGTQPIFVHPNPVVYHFDVMTRWRKPDGSAGVFFVSFPGRFLAEILASSQLHGHQLMLLHHQRTGLIEISGAGTRNRIGREIYLTKDERERVVYSVPVPGSLWDLVDLGPADATEVRRGALRTQVLSIFGVFLLISGTMAAVSVRAELQRFRAELALQEHHDLLELRVERRTKELSQAKTAAERANGAKSRFLAAASHDLRQPLQTLGLFNGVLERRLGLLRASSDPSTGAAMGELLGIVRDQRGVVENMTTALARLLDLSRLEAGGIEAKPNDFSIGLLLEDLVSSYRSRARDKGVELRLAPCSARVYSDRALLERVLENLLSNAVKYTDRGRVLVGCRRRGQCLRIEVWDTGHGIAEDRRELVFEAFYQLENPAREARKGVGLGLAIVQQLCELLHHSLDLRSTPGRGSMFSVEVPLAVEEDSVS